MLFFIAAKEARGDVDHEPAKKKAKKVTNISTCMFFKFWNRYKIQ